MVASKRKTASRMVVTPGTLEENRIRKEAEKDAQARALRLASLKNSSLTEKLSSQIKLPVTLRSVYDTFVKRVKATPVKVMRSEEPDPFGHKPRVLKIESRFLELTLSQVMTAMAGLDVYKPLTKMKDLSYSHIAQWGYKGTSIKFRVSMYRYKDRSCLFIFTPE